MAGGWTDGSLSIVRGSSCVWAWNPLCPSSLAVRMGSAVWSATLHEMLAGHVIRKGPLVPRHMFLGDLLAIDLHPFLASLTSAARNRMQTVGATVDSNAAADIVTIVG